ncbi:hypothetical protein Y1Q_0021684 [Alligator mississippiensis]|uniref:Uncharacterized protein n=1 Tax=Alligator mississippiensis TaxID=8496 RepID=A0A151PAR2_ALLMI|nr:hypothetical protein Y1Q_0021684 [Alligator mississippiensis]
MLERNNSPVDDEEEDSDSPVIVSQDLSGSKGSTVSGRQWQSPETETLLSSRRVICAPSSSSSRAAANAQLQYREMLWSSGACPCPHLAAGALSGCDGAKNRRKQP